jgi:hypothetical protein
MGCKINLGILFFILIVVFSSFTSAYASVSPGGYTINFQPKLAAKFTFYFGTDNPDAEFNVSVYGDLAEYAKVSPSYFKGGGGVEVTLELPEKIDTPGQHRIRIIPQQASSAGGTGAVAAVATVAGAIDVFVPYPGVYIESSFNTVNANAGEPVNLGLTITNKGTDAVPIDSFVDIYDSSEKKIETVPFESKVINPTESVTLSKQLTTNGYGSGNYKAVATINYYNEQKTLESSFKLGELYVDVVNSTREFEKGKINPVFVEVQSFWNDPIDGVYVSGKVVGYDINFQTLSTGLTSWETKRTEGFFDTSVIKGDNFKLNLTVHYSGKTTEKIVDVGFKKETNYLMWGIIAGAIVLIGIIIFIIYKTRSINHNTTRRK